MTQENFWVLISKKLSGEASFHEREELQQIIQQHPEWQLAIQNLEDIWKQQQSTDIMQSEDAYLLHLHKMKEMNLFSDNYSTEVPAIGSNRNLKKWNWAAAAIIIAAGIFGFIRITGSKDEKEILASHVNEVSTRPGSKSKIQLPDGSTVWLNADSKLDYNKNFNGELREVHLTGEAFFDVVKMNDKPFIIHTSTINIKVLGTAFNVKAYPDDKQTETSLIRGSIEVTIKNRPNDKIMLSPSEKLIVENNLLKEKINGTINAVTKEPVPPLVSINKLKYSAVDSTVAEMQWINNKLIFREETFADLVVKMERWYDVTIEINDPKLKQARLNGIFESETIIQALEALQISIPFRYEQTGNKIIIHQ